MALGYLLHLSTVWLPRFFPSLIPVEAKTGHGVAVYFEAACMIVSLSLLGQILELKARSQTANSLKFYYVYNLLKETGSV